MNPPPTAPAATLFDAYQPPPGGRDEMATAPGKFRAHWRPLVEALGSMGRTELLRRWEQARALMREGGVTIAADNDPRGFDRPWEFDLLPHLIGPDDWKVLEPALLQRAVLLERITADLYGQQSLLRTGLLPPALVFGQQGFLRPLHGLRPPHGRWLHLIAFDVARTEAGDWIVLGNRTQTPSGAGYALENRATLVRVLPDLYHECRVRRMLPFFDALRESLIALAPPGRENPRVVLMSPGPDRAGYFEQLFLARHLGFPILEGGDLTTRDNRVFVKTLGGLTPVDVVLRRVEDHQCDPLELDYASHLGLPGLVQAAHGGNVAVANALGSGLVGSPSFLPFLPTVCRHLMGENLLLASAPTQWCGDVRAQRRAEQEIGTLILKHAPGDGRLHARHGASMSEGDRAALLARVREAPTEYVIQEPVAVTTTPAWADGALLPRRVIVRLFAVATPDGYMVMPGGLALTSSAWETNIVSLEYATAAKDAWVLSEEPVNAPTVLAPLSAPVKLARSGMDMPSRVADNLFWLGRYTERAEGYIRLMRGVLAHVIDETQPTDDSEIDPLLAHLVARQAAPSSLMEAREEGREEELERELVAFVAAPGQPHNLRGLVTALHKTLWLVRDRVSLDAWRMLSLLERRFPEPARAGSLDTSAALGLLDDLLLPLTAFSGLAGESMTRGPGWRFMDMGRRIERAHAAAGVLLNALSGKRPHEGAVLQLLLDVMDSSMTYRSRYLSSLHPHAVLDLLLTDETNPRSVIFQVAALEAHIAELVRGTVRAGMEPEARAAAALLMQLRLADVAVLSEPGPEGVRRNLAALLGEVEAAMPVLSDTLARRYFSHSDPPRAHGA